MSEFSCDHENKCHLVIGWSIHSSRVGVDLSSSIRSCSAPSAFSIDRRAVLVVHATSYAAWTNILENKYIAYFVSVQDLYKLVCPKISKRKDWLFRRSLSFFRIFMFTEEYGGRGGGGEGYQYVDNILISWKLALVIFMLLGWYRGFFGALLFTPSEKCSPVTSNFTVWYEWCWFVDIQSVIEFKFLAKIRTGETKKGVGIRKIINEEAFRRLVSQSYHSFTNSF